MDDLMGDYFPFTVTVDQGCKTEQEIENDHAVEYMMHEAEDLISENGSAIVFS